MHLYRLSIIGFVAAIIGCVAHPDESASPVAHEVPDKIDEPKPAAETKKVQIGKNIFLEVQGQQRRVRVNAEVCLREGMLEQLVTKKRQKEHEAILAADIDARELLEGYFDFHYRHRHDLILVLAEISMLADLGLIDKVLAWRDRLGKLVFGPRPTLAQSTRAVVAFGGLQDCCLQFPDTPYEALRQASVKSALDALGM